MVGYKLSSFWCFTFRYAEPKTLGKKVREKKGFDHCSSEV